VISTNVEEFRLFLRLLARSGIRLDDLWFIPVRGDKSPDASKGANLKSEEHRLGTSEALERIEEGENVGIYLKDSLVVFDVDDPEKAPLDDDLFSKTLTVKSRSGKPHIYFKKGEGVEGADIPDVVELRTGWRYVLVPGSCAYDKEEYEETGRKNWGLYEVASENDLIEIGRDDLPDELKPSETPEVSVDEAPGDETPTLRSSTGEKLEDVRERDEKLDALLSELNPPEYDYPSRSEADMAAMIKLLGHGFDESQITHILREYRDYEKTRRDDYIERTLSKSKEVAEEIGALGGEEERFSWRGIAKQILEENHFVTAEDSKQIYVYEDGVYRDRGDVEIEIQAQELIPEKKISTGVVNQIKNFIRRETYVRREKFDNPRHLLNLKNGLLDLREGKFIDHTPEHISTTQLPVEYDPNADCPRFKEWLIETVGPNQVGKAKQAMGCCLLKDYRYDLFFVLVGEGSNGKTTFLKILRMLLGKENVSSQALQDLTTRRFSVAQLHGKLANLCGDLPMKKLRNTGMIKQLMGDLVPAQRKFQPLFQFENYATLIFSANKLPRSPDETYAFHRRIAIIDFPFRFVSEEELDPDDPRQKKRRELNEILTDMAEELPGILNFALEGLKEVVESGEVTEVETVAERAERYKRESDSVWSFAGQHLRERDDHYEEKGIVFKKYTKFCRKNGFKPLSHSQFSQRLPSVISTYGGQVRTGDGRRPKVWRDIELVDGDDGKGVSTVSTVSTHPPSLSSQQGEQEDSPSPSPSPPPSKSTDRGELKEKTTVDTVDTVDAYCARSEIGTLPPDERQRYLAEMEEDARYCYDCFSDRKELVEAEEVVERSYGKYWLCAECIAKRELASYKKKHPWIDDLDIPARKVRKFLQAVSEATAKEDPAPLDLVKEQMPWWDPGEFKRIVKRAVEEGDLYEPAPGCFSLTRESLHAGTIEKIGEKRHACEECRKRGIKDNFNTEKYRISGREVWLCDDCARSGGLKGD